MQNRTSNHYFNFTKKEKTGTLFLLFIIFLLIATPTIYSLIFKEPEISMDDHKSEIASLKMKQAENNKMDSGDSYTEFRNNNKYENISNKKNEFAAALFFFDPNTLSPEGWKKLGLKEKTILTIQRYLSKGGKFKQPSDIEKIWGLNKDQISAFIPYVKIEQKLRDQTMKAPDYEKTVYSKKSISPIDINTADSASLVSLPGIGPGYARRIIKFRDKLGGFYDVNQVSETFGMPDSVFQKIKDQLRVSGDHVHTININTASLEELKEHPYIRYQIANAMLAFRKQHGNFNAVDDVKKIMLITEEIFLKLAPYLTVN